MKIREQRLANRNFGYIGFLVDISMVSTFWANFYFNLRFKFDYVLSWKGRELNRLFGKFIDYLDKQEHRFVFLFSLKFPAFSFELTSCTKYSIDFAWVRMKKCLTVSKGENGEF